MLYVCNVSDVYSHYNVYDVVYIFREVTLPIR